MRQLSVRYVIGNVADAKRSTTVKSLPCTPDSPDTLPCLTTASCVRRQKPLWLQLVIVALRAHWILHQGWERNDIPILDW